MTLILAEDLKKEFSIWAHFYKREVGGKEYLMRSEAKILRNKKEEKPADAVIVMANPGSCSAVDLTAKFEVLPDDLTNKIFVRARPDQTQYQLMNLMERMQWDCIKIVNISDLVTGNYTVFKQLLKELQEIGFKGHSIFSEKRIDEFKKILEEKPTLIYAWGGDEVIRKYTDLVIKNNFEHKGVKHSAGYYLHPRPATHKNRKIWLDKMVKNLKGEPE